MYKFSSLVKQWFCYFTKIKHLALQQLIQIIICILILVNYCIETLIFKIDYN